MSAHFLRAFTSPTCKRGTASNIPSLVAMGATANHCAFYLMSSSTVEAHQDELKDYDTSKGTIRFPADKPLPVALVRKLVKARLAENVGRLRESK